VSYDSNFRLYLICQLPNPHFTPETLIKRNLLNFTLIPEAAKYQMLFILSISEDEDLEKEKI
jgi:dynein heavy chain, axonemal